MALDGEQHPRAVALREARDGVLTRLSEGFARDELSLDELERRVERAFAAGDEPELSALVVDLAPPAFAPGVLVRAPAGPLASTAPRRTSAILGNVERRVSHLLPGARVSAILGNVELDLRDVTLPPGVTEIEVRAVFGNVELTIPPTLAVECVGTSVLGSFASVHRVPRGTPDEPVLRVTGAAVLGNVEVKTLPSRALLEVVRRARLAQPSEGGER